MRTPWRFVADLVSRKPRVSSADAPTPQPDEVKALEYRPIPEADDVGASRLEADQSSFVADAPATEPVPEFVPTTIDAVTIPEEGLDDSALRDENFEDRKIAPVDAEPTSAASENEATAPVVITLGEDPKPQQRPSKLVRRRAQTAQASEQPVEATPIIAVPVQQLASPKTFFEEMAELDNEVAALRTELARKLAMQNTQLRKMLDRFER